MSQKKFILLMAMIMAAVPFAIDAYLPAMPYMAKYFHVGAEDIATTISFYILGMAFGQLIGGSLADKFSRKYLILTGMIIYAICSILITQTNTLLVIQISRIIQAIGGGIAIVCIPTLIRDKAVGNEAAKIFSLIMLVMVIAPAIAPSIGALILLLGHWQNIFYFLFIYSLLVIALIYAMPKDKPIQKTQVPVLKRYLLVIQHYPALPYIFIQSFSFSLMMVFITNASFIYQGYFKLGDQIFALVFAGNVVMMAITNRVNSFFLSKISAKSLLGYALIIQLVAVLLFTFLVAIKASMIFIAASIIFMIGTVGAISPNANAIFISHYKEHTGSASAVIGVSQFLSAAITGGITTVFYNASLWPIAIMMLALSLGANIFFKNYTKT